jgi:MFS transporter, CP family, cyanate transporter
MTTSLPQQEASSAARLYLCIALLWLGGVGLRVTILAVPPVLPLIHADLHMSETDVGILSGLPPVLFACAAVPGSLLIARFGALSTLVFGLLATAVGSALRGAAPNVPLLLAATVLTGFGVAIMQPSLAPLVRGWLPDRVGFGTAVYTNGLIIGEIFPIALTFPMVLPLVGGSWRLTFVAWGIPIVLIALVIFWLAPRRSAAQRQAAPRRWWPDWKNPLIWRLGLMLGSVNGMYFGANAFLPDFLTHTGRSDLIGPALVALNVGQLPSSFLMLPITDRLVRQAWPYVLCGLICLATMLGIMWGSAAVVIASAATFGFFGAAILILMLALPPLLSPPDDVHRVSAAMFTISYSCAMLMSVVSGLVWDTSGIPAAAFAPLALSGFMLITLAPAVTLRAERVAIPS